MYTLYIGNKNYSSWSLRGWLAAKLSGAPFREVHVPLVGKGANPANRTFSPSGLVPCLHDADTIVWDTFAIAEYLAERHAGMWPADPRARAFGRSIAAEMHSGFSALRNEMSMCIRERVDVRPWSQALRDVNALRLHANGRDRRARCRRDECRHHDRTKPGHVCRLTRCFAGHDVRIGASWSGACSY